MKKVKFLFLILIVVVVALIVSSTSLRVAKADELSDSISEQLDNLDLSELESFFDTIIDGQSDTNFYIYIGNLLNGDYDADYSSLFSYILNLFFDDIYQSIPIFIGVVAISIFCGIMQSAKSSFVSNSVSDLIFFVCFIAVIGLLSSRIFLIYSEVEINIENIAKLTEIMSPIILSLMLATGSKVSASVFSPTVALLSNVVINIMLAVVLPLIGIMFVFSIISNITQQSVKFSKYSDFVQSTIKWILGILITVFTLFLSIQGITAARFDGISFKAAKYFISNSVPIVGGFIKDGFDLVLAGSVLIKNAIGVAAVFLLFYIVLMPVVKIAVYSLLLKLVSALIEPISDSRISGFCTAVSKCLNYLTAVLLVVGLMVFITIMLMVMASGEVL